MVKILVSSCLLGCAVRYNGSAVEVHSADFNWLLETQDIVALCPEISVGLPIPRVPAEILGGDGVAVLSGSAQILGSDKSDLSDKFVLGAELALRLCKEQDIQYAVLTENSPSCGSQYIYDGNFSGIKKKGSGVVAAILMQSGIRVFSQYAASELRRLISIVR
ncbi:DUF523 domain-containing protein [Microbulbifer sp. OS29]|uniref:DUF523 domain-containing protein n=1 Tax=Microbulbifer okhotskensis TaxID=2926617 RepID=A0A9X2J767_9GAMM|nr:DUF523 domain-containing protein [Microbulbifer okhotskensis]MCO1334141.1 DUF523 domain-containing protein [Microbulbifer okhotskensis]